MHKLTPEGEQVVAEIARRYGLSNQAVEQMLDAVACGGGSMAQFNIPELGGSGQWMQGGMTMVGDMFNHGLKMTVDNLCAELATLYFNQPYAPPPKPVQAGEGVSLFVPGSGASNWWPQELGQPGSSGSQNNMRYAYFPQAHRLAVEAGGMRAVYDTLNHQINGFSQQQSGDGSITLTSQFGVVSLAALPRVDWDNPLAPAPKIPPAPPVETPPPAAHPARETAAPDPEPQERSPDPQERSPDPQERSPDPQERSQNPQGQGSDQIFATIEKLGGLMAKGLITEQEFNDKKAELLDRL